MTMSARSHHIAVAAHGAAGSRSSSSASAMLMNALDGSVVNVALPEIQADLHFSRRT